MLFLSLGPLRRLCRERIHREKDIERGVSRERGIQGEEYGEEYIGRRIYRERAIEKSMWREEYPGCGVYREGSTESNGSRDKGSTNSDCKRGSKISQRKT